MNKEELEKLSKLDYYKWGNSDGADTEVLFNQMQKLAKLCLKQQEYLENLNELIKEYEEDEKKMAVRILELENRIDDSATTKILLETKND